MKFTPFFTILALCFSSVVSADDHAPKGSRPNILFILADDLGYADVSFNTKAGVEPEIETPELDQLAKGGAIFNSAYVVHPFCGPSRMGLFAGRYPHEFGGPFNLPDDSTGNYTDQGIPTSETLMSAVLQKAGYRTGLMGKWHLGQKPEFHPNKRGFDQFYGFLGGGIMYWGPYKSTGWDYYRHPEENGEPDTSLTSKDHITDVLTRKGIEFINESAKGEDPFFLFMSYNAPHSVLTDHRGGQHPEAQAHEADMDRFPKLRGNRKIYAGLVYGMDRCVGELVQALKDSKQYENTLIVFLSDNGGREDEMGSGDNGVLKGNKGDVDEGGFRVPMFMHWPGVIPAGKSYDHPVTALDFYPTFVSLAGAKIPESQELDGKDIWKPFLAGQSARPGQPIYTVVYRNDVSNVGIRQDDWKAVKVKKQRWKLYDIAEDLSEKKDLSKSKSDVLEAMVSEGGSWAKDHVQPLWWNSPGSEKEWKRDKMPRYGETFEMR